MDEFRPDVVLTHPYEGGHSDHDATEFAVHLACEILRRDNVPAPLVLELTSYHNFSGTRRVFNLLPFIGAEERTIQLTDAEKGLKKRMYQEFALHSPAPVRAGRRDLATPRRARSSKVCKLDDTPIVSGGVSPLLVSP